MDAMDVEQFFVDVVNPDQDPIELDYDEASNEAFPAINKEVLDYLEAEEIGNTKRLTLDSDEDDEVFPVMCKVRDSIEAELKRQWIVSPMSVKVRIRSAEQKIKQSIAVATVESSTQPPDSTPALHASKIDSILKEMDKEYGALKKKRTTSKKERKKAPKRPKSDQPMEKAQAEQLPSAHPPHQEHPDCQMTTLHLWSTETIETNPPVKSFMVNNYAAIRQFAEMQVPSLSTALLISLFSRRVSANNAMFLADAINSTNQKDCMFSVFVREFQTAERINELWDQRQLLRILGVWAGADPNLRSLITAENHLPIHLSAEDFTSENIGFVLFLDRLRRSLELATSEMRRRWMSPTSMLVNKPTIIVGNIALKAAKYTDRKGTDIIETKEDPRTSFFVGPRVNQIVFLYTAEYDVLELLSIMFTIYGSTNMKVCLILELKEKDHELLKQFIIVAEKNRVPVSTFQRKEELGQILDQMKVKTLNATDRVEDSVTIPQPRPQLKARRLICNNCNGIGHKARVCPSIL